MNENQPQPLAKRSPSPGSSGAAWIPPRKKRGEIWATKVSGEGTGGGPYLAFLRDVGRDDSGDPNQVNLYARTDLSHLEKRISVCDNCQTGATWAMDLAASMIQQAQAAKIPVIVGTLPEFGRGPLATSLAGSLDEEAVASLTPKVAGVR